VKRAWWLVVLVCGAWDPVTRPQRDVADGNQQLQAGKLSEAEAHYQKALEALPGQPGILFDLGTAHYAQAQALPKGPERTKLLDAAEKELRLAGDAPDTQLRASAHYNLGNALFQEDKFKEAVEEYKKSLKLEPTREDARKNLELALVRIPPPPPPQGGGGDKQKPPEDQQQQQQQQSQGQGQQQQEQKPQPQPTPEDQQKPPEPQQGEKEQPKPSDDDAERKLDALERGSCDLQNDKARQRAKQRRLRPGKDW
jgi:tetratricopeptide (TPR) repeat protein